MGTVLVVDDEQSITWAFEKFLTSLGHSVRSAPTAEQGLEIARRDPPDLVILDIRLPGMDGLSALEEIRKLNPTARVIIITAHGTLETAVRAVKLGAVDYLAKPVDLVKARRLIESALSGPRASREVEKLRGEPPFGGLVGRTPGMQEVFRKVAAVCESDVTVLFTGESGTGKELLARALHASSRRSNGPFEPVNCAAIPETLLESELFGHEKGAFTGAHRQKRGKCEIADGGTLFLDEIGDIPVSTQVKLLRFLEERTFSRVGGTEPVKVDVRLVSATNSDLEERVASGAFREDLFFRLNVVRIEIPPLRDRRDDIALLVAHFVELWGAEGISQEALEILKNHPWPGNVRELRNAIERGVVLSRKRTILPEHLPDSVLRPRSPGGGSTDARVAELVDAIALAPDAPRTGLFRIVEEKWERALLRRALEMTGGNQVRAAQLLGINRLTLRKKIARYGL
jgi:two-component system response regulator AtoC